MHYEDKEDLIKKLLDDSAMKIESFLGAADFLKKTTFTNISELQIRWGLRSILKVMEEGQIESFSLWIIVRSYAAAPLLSDDFTPIYIRISQPVPKAGRTLVISCRG